MKKNLLKIALILVLVLTACIVFAACDPDNPEEKKMSNLCSGDLLSSRKWQKK